MKRGFTLIELLVYMAIMSFVIIVAGRVFSDSTVMRVRSQNMIKNSEEVGRVSNLIKEDISQMGVKAWGQNVSGDEYTVHNVGEYNPKIYRNTAQGDSSSYTLVHRTRINPNPPKDTTYYDSIVFYKAAFDGDGKFLGIREIAWYARADSLWRRCATVQKNKVNGTDNDATVCPESGVSAPVLIAKNITNFHIIPSKPGINSSSIDTLFGKSADRFRLISRTTDNGNKVKEITDTIHTGTETTVSNFAQNTGTEKFHNQLYLVEGTTETDYKNCKKFSFKKGETYAIEFKMPLLSLSTASNAADSLAILNSTQFVPGRDHLAIGLRTGGVANPTRPAGAPNDILFYPAQSDEAANLTRHLEFSVSQDLNNNACIAIIMAYYSPDTKSAGEFSGAGGKLRFSDFKIFPKADEAFNFPKKDDDDYDKYGTSQAGGDSINQKRNAKAFELILEMVNKGEKSGTYASEGKGMVITTPNNGIVPRN